MNRRGRIVRDDRDVAASFVASLSQFAHRVPFHRQVRPGNLDQRRCHGRHDERKEERIPLLAPGVHIRHERGLVHTRRERIHKVEEEGDDEQDRVARSDVFEPVRPIVVRQWGYRGRWWYGQCLVLLVRPVE